MQSNGTLYSPLIEHTTQCRPTVVAAAATTTATTTTILRPSLPARPPPTILVFLFNSPFPSFLFADDMQCHCSGRPTEAPLTASRLERCIADVSAWCASRRLQLNGDKTELLWFGSATHLRQLPSARSISVNNSVVQPLTVVRDLGVWIDSELSMREHVSRVAQICFFICAVYARFVDNSVATSLHDWSRLSCCRDWTIATLSSPVFQRQLWHRCSES